MDACRASGCLLVSLRQPALLDVRAADMRKDKRKYGYPAATPVAGARLFTLAEGMSTRANTD